MAKDNNLKDYLTDLYEGIKTKNPNASRNPQDFRTEIESISTGIEGVTEENGTIGIKENSSSTKIYLGSANNIKDIEIVKNQVNVRLYSNDPKVVCYGSNTQIEMMSTNKAVATNLTPENIKKDVNVLGHIGTFEGGVEGVTEKFGAITIDGNTTSTLVNIIDQKEVELTGTPKRVTSYIEGNTFKSYYSANVELAGGKITAENLTPENIKKGVTILGHVGTFEGGTNTSDATATASDILLGKTAYGKEGRIVGAIETYDGASDVGSSGNVLKRILDATKTINSLFKNYPNDDLSELIQYSDTENVTNFSYMYSNCKATEFPLINTSNGTNFSFMYQSCSKATEFPPIDTSNGIDFSYMYSNCSKATEFPHIYTPKGTNFNNMYSSCSSATEFPPIDTSNGTNFSYMYYSCIGVKKIDISKFTSNSTSYSNYFCNNCVRLKALIIRSFGDSYVLNSNAFSVCWWLNGETHSKYNPNGEQGYIYVPRDMIETLQSATNWSTMQFRALEDYTLDGTCWGEFDDAKAGLV